MNIKPSDISPEMREFYKWLRGRPGMWIGKNKINNLNVFIILMSMAKVILVDMEDATDKKKL